MAQETFVLQEITLGQLLRNTALRFPHNDAAVYIDKDFRQTWAQLDADVDALAKGMMALGIQHGERIAIWATNVPHWITVMFAAARIGAVLLNVNTSYREKELGYLLEQSACETIFLADGFRDHDFIQTLNAVIPELKTQSRDTLCCKQYPHLKRLLFLGEEKYRLMYSLPEIMHLGEQVSDDEYAARQAGVNPHDVVNMQYTSGTTGYPKGVMLSHVNILNNGYWIGRKQKFTHNDRLCLPVPLFHCFGCVLGVMSCVNHGTTMVILETFNTVQALTAIESEKCTALYGVPTMFISIMEHRVFNKFDVSSLRTGIMAGSVCPEPLMRRVTDVLYMKEITSVYGLTESSPGMSQTSADDSFERRTKTVGRALPGVEVKIVNPDTFEDMPPNTEGEVVCKGYNVMKGYYNMPKATQEAITPDGWLHSGDLGFMDEDGYLVISGRIKDMIIRAGENIYPREVEEFLSGMQGVFDVQVVGVPSRKYGEEVGAFIIPKPGAGIGAEDVREFCRGKIAWHKVPRYIAFVEEYPMTASGKVQKYKLRETAAILFPEAMKEKKQQSAE